MSNVFTIAAVEGHWREAVLGGLLAVSVILWLVWGIKALIRGDKSPWGLGRENRPGLPEAALAVSSMVAFAWLWLRILKGVLAWESLEKALAGGLAELLSCFLILGLLGWKGPERLKALGLKAKGLAGNLGWGTVLAVAVWPITTLLLVPVSLWTMQTVCHWLWDLNYTAQAHTLLREISETSPAGQLWLVVILAVVVAPLTEEILFRGLLQGWLAGLSRSRWTAIVAGAAIFALFHLAARENASVGEVSLARVETIPALFFLGVVLGYAYEKSGSLWRSMAIHLVFNGLSLAMAWGQM